MERRRLGHSGVEVSRIILGCGNFGGIGSAPELFGCGESRDEAFALMDAAWAAGITAFDTADAYGGGRSETWIGDWMRERGHRPTLTTKTFNPMAAGAESGLSPERVRRQLASSLERLGVERLDCYLAHEFDPETPLADTITAFEELASADAIGSWGVSNFSEAQLRDTLALGPPVVVQNAYSLLQRDDEASVLPLCAEHGVGYTAFSPLAGGWLARRYRRGEPPPAGSRMAVRPGPYEEFRTERTFDALDALEAAAHERGVDSATLAVAWLLAQPGVTAVIVGPRRPEQLEPALTALELGLSSAEAHELASLVA